MLTYDNLARRCDFNLRLRFIGLKTRIFRIQQFKYVFYCMDVPVDFTVLQKTFDREIRFVTLHVDLVKTLPSEYEEELTAILFEQPVDDFKACAITRADMEEYILTRYRDFDVRKIVPSEGGIDFHVDIYVGPKISEEKKEQLKNELIQADFGTSQIEIHTTGEEKVPRKKLDTEYRAFHLVTPEDSLLSAGEADMWYHNLNAVYEGRMTRKDMSFLRPGLSKCFVNASLFKTVNLRNLLLIYDTVYLSLPIAEQMDDFLDNQAITREELVQLVERGNVVLMLPNDELRYEQPLIRDAYTNMPDGVIGRRGMNLMLISQLVEMKDRYLARYPFAYEVATDIYRLGQKQNCQEYLKMADLIAWPIRAVAESFSSFQICGPNSIGSFGINKPIYEFLKKNDQGNAIEFEFLTKAEAAHISMALDATYFPFHEKNSYGIYSDEKETSFMGSMLRTFWYDPEQMSGIKSIWEENEREQNMLNLFSAEENVSVLQTTDLADRFHTQEDFRQILQGLSSMDEKSRKKQLFEYNNLLAELRKQDLRKGSVIQMALGCTGFFPLSKTLSAILTLVGLFGSAKDMMSVRQQQNMVLERLAKEMGLDNPKQAAKDVNLLDNISPVAHLSID